MLKNKTFTFDI